MAVKTKDELKALCNDGDLLTEPEYVDLIDSMVVDPPTLLKRTAPSTPSADNIVIYNENDNLKFKDDVGNVANLSYNRLYPYELHPSDLYPQSIRTFYRNDFVNNLAGFQDSQASPYSFGGSPGGFSLYVPASFVAESQTYRHHLRMSDAGAASPGYLQWSSSTGRMYCDLWMSLFSYGSAVPDAISFEIRMWAVQNPGAADKYFALRFKRTSIGLCIFGYYGTGVTITVGDGTAQGSSFLPTEVKYRMNFQVSTTPSLSVGIQNDMDGILAYYFGISGGAGYPSTIKTFRIYVLGWAACYIDAMRVYG